MSRRRRIMNVLGRFIFILGSLAILGACSSEADRPVMFRGNSQHTGVYVTQGVESLSGIKWVFKTGGKIVSSAALRNETVYFGSADTYLYAVNGETGQERWKFKTNGSVTSSPTVSKGMVYFGSEDGYFYGVECKSGKMKWKFRTEGEKQFGAPGLWGMTPKDQMLYDPWDFFISSPVIDDGIVYFGSGDGHIYALDMKTGREKWKYRTEGSVHSSPAIFDEKVYCGSWDSYLYAINAKTGDEVWKFNTGRDEDYHLYEGIQSSPAIADSMVYIGCRSARLLALDAETGQKEWEYETGGPWVPTSPAVYKGGIYFGTSDSYLFVGLEGKTGEKKFEFSAGAWVFSSPAMVGETAYFGCHNGRLYAVDILTGDKKWEFQTEASRLNVGQCYTVEGRVNREAFVPSPDPENTFAHYVSLVNDKVLSAGGILSSPVVADGVIYFGSLDGYFYAIK